MFFFFSNRLGCLGSLLLSAVVTVAGSYRRLLEREFLHYGILVRASALTVL
jgi:hypothetical protein